ncbi:MAG TPA: hypothetical protein VGR38_08155 [Candidatus Polarisedimenticolia bacterium]|nr:hypothetical protein [Candidatus Polarisedimenticolia bacterium]
MHRREARDRESLDPLGDAVRGGAIQTRPSSAGTWLLAVFLLQIVYQGCFFLRGLEYLVSRLAIDDTYYYLQVAWNTPRLGFVTFDGLHRTNGLQFLWNWVLTAVGAVMPSKNALLEACVGLCLLLNALCYVPIYRIGQALGRPRFAIFLAFLWLNVNLTGSRWTLCGMENSLHSLVAWALIASGVSIGQSEQGARARNWVGFSLLLVLNVWCRVDAAILSILLYGVVLSRERRWVSRRILLATTGIAAAGGVVLFGGFYAMGRSWMPVSALIKSHSHVWTLKNFTVLAARGFDFVTPISFLALSSLGEAVRMVWMPMMLGIATLALAWRAARAEGFRTSRLAPLWAAFGVAGLVQLIVLSGMGTYGTYGVWYQSPYFVFCALTVAMAMDELVEIGIRRAWLTARTLHRAAVVALILYGGFAAAWFARLARDDDYRESSFFYSAYRVAEWIRENTGETDVLAAFNAGEIGYFSQRTMINLDGLVNDYDYYAEVIRGTKKLDAYLSENRVRYFVDYQIPEDLLERAAVVFTLKHDERSVFRVVDLSSALPSP